MMNVVMMTSLPVADCSTVLLLRRKKLDRQWFGDGSEVQPVPRSTKNEGVVGLKVQRPAVGRQPGRPARIHEDTGVPTQLACMQFALVHVTSVDDGAAVSIFHDVVESRRKSRVKRDETLSERLLDCCG